MVAREKPVEPLQASGSEVTGRDNLDLHLQIRIYFFCFVFTRSFIVFEIDLTFTLLHLFVQW